MPAKRFCVAHILTPVAHSPSAHRYTGAYYKLHPRVLAHSNSHSQYRKSLSVTGTEVFHSQFEYACVNVNVNVNVLVVRLLKEKDTYARRTTKEAGAASEAGSAVQRSAIDSKIPCRQLSGSRQQHDSCQLRQ